MRTKPSLINLNSALVLSYKNEKQIDEIIIEMKNLFEKFTENELLSFKEQIIQNIIFCFKTIYKKIEFENVTIEVEKIMNEIQDAVTLTGFDTKKLREIYDFEEFQKILKKENEVVLTSFP